MPKARKAATAISRGGLSLEGEDTPPDRPGGPHTSIGVADQRTTRSASAIAHAFAWGSAEGEFRARELDLTIEVGTDGNLGGGESITGATLATVTFTAHGQDQGVSFKEEEKVTFNTELGNLPLFIMALQDALRLGIERGSFPDPHGVALTDFSNPVPDAGSDDDPSEAS
jgi:hypothetical protein